MLLSQAEENYIKAIYHLSNNGRNEVSTNAIAEVLQTKPASVSDMLRKLNQKELIEYEKYKGVKIAPLGVKTSLKIIRKHRLWEVFLVEKLKFNWDEVHDIAEQLEHINSPELINRLDNFLGNPEYDPHGDPIPNEHGDMRIKKKRSLSQLITGESSHVVGVKDSGSLFLQHLDKIGIGLGTQIKVIEINVFDGSFEIQTNKKQEQQISLTVAENILIA